MTTRNDQIAFAWEPLDTLLDDGLEKLVRQHWNEVGVFKREMPLAPDWDGYRARERQGLLHILAARRAAKLIGYCSWIVLSGHLHYKTTVFAVCDAIFIPTRYRKTGAGARLMLKSEADIVARWPGRSIRFEYHDKVALKHLAPALTKRGFEAIDVSLAKIVRA